MEQDVLKSKGKAILLGNEAVVRGALEAGVQFVSTYPGTPASEIGNIFYKIAKKTGVYFEFSTNEKVAMEAGAGASFCNLRTLVAMKNFGLNVASDFFLPLIYSGIKGGMVILMADDPSCWSSAQTEENTRGFAALSHIPILEPSTAEECKEFTKFAFELSEEFKIPVMVRETTRVSHQSAPVILKKIIRGKRKGKFIKDPHQFSTMPPRVLEMHQELLDKIETIRKIAEKSKINIVQNQKKGSANKNKLGIITSGASFLYTKEALSEMNLNLPILKLGFFHPLPNNKIKNFIKDLKKVLIVEELDPYLEKAVNIIAKDVNPSLKVEGKSLLPEVRELKQEYVISAIAKFTGKKSKIDFQKHIKKFQELKIPKRSPVLCPGCPYWGVFPVLKRILNEKEVIFGGEIGCYMLAAFAPHNIQDYLYCMGSSIGISHGIKKVTKQKLITFTGDGSFFHASIPALINAVFNKSNPLVIIMDNGITAMTGHQPNPGMELKEDNTKKIKIEDIVRACGVKNLKIVDQIKEPKKFESAVKEFIKKDEISVIIARHPCLFANRKQ